MSKALAFDLLGKGRGPSDVEGMKLLCQKGQGFELSVQEKRLRRRLVYINYPFTTAVNYRTKALR